MKSFIGMKNQIIIVIAILSVALLLSSILMEFQALATPNPFGQQVTFDSIVRDGRGSASHVTNNRMSDSNMVAISTTTGTNGGAISTPSGNTNQTNQTTPMISVVDVINSTYIVPKEIDEDDSERRISRAIRDRINDISHTVVMSNATIISTATISNSFVDESTTVNNYTRLLEIIPDQVEVALAGIRAASQPANPTIEIQTDIETVCDANNTTLAECNINIRIH
jgi:hypothetical protein